MLFHALREVREWAKYAYGFLAGIFVASLVALVVLRWEGIVEVLRRVWERSLTGVREVRERLGLGKVWKEEERGGMPKQPVEEDETTPTPKKPVELRKRLWNEPPNNKNLNDYSYYEYFDIVQKEFKEMGGKDFEWKTKWLDLWTENLLLYDYRGWAGDQSKEKEASEKDRAFHRQLYKDLNIEGSDVWEEKKENNRLHGKDSEDEDELIALMREIRAREEQKRKKA